MYDANRAPEPNWLSCAPADKLRQVTAFHAVQRVAAGPLKSHAALHVIVEDLIARGDGPVVRSMARLQQQGMTRHEALHAVGETVASHRHKHAVAPADGWQRRLNDALNALAAARPA
jgi:hypothetical protein